jgi:hypothetical protein
MLIRSIKSLKNEFNGIAVRPHCEGFRWSEKVQGGVSRLLRLLAVRHSLRGQSTQPRPSDHPAIHEKYYRQFKRIGMLKFWLPTRTFL